MSSGQVLFDVPNALDTRQPMPVPGGPTAEQLGTIMLLFFGGITWGFVDLFTDRELLPDMQLLGVVALFAVIFAFVRPQGHRLTYWFMLGNRQIVLRLVGRLSWGLFRKVPADVTRQLISLSGAPDGGAVVISGSWAHVLYSNARVESDGTVDMTGLPEAIPRLIRLLIALLLRGQPPYRALILIRGISSLADLHDVQAQAAMFARRGRMWFKLQMPCSAHAMIVPLDPDKIAYTAGATGQLNDRGQDLAEVNARALALGQLDGQQQGLVERECYLAVPGATRSMLKGRVQQAIAVLAESGRNPQVLGQSEVDAILDREWGRGRNRPLAIGMERAWIKGRQWVTFYLTRLERQVPLDVLAPFLDGSLLARVAVYSWPIGTASAKFMLWARGMLWKAAAWEGNQDFIEAAQDSESVTTELRNQGSLHRTSVVISVPEEQREEAERLLRIQHVETNGWVVATRRQDTAARAALPVHSPELLDKRLANAGAMGLLTPWSGCTLWVPPTPDGKPHAVLIGHALPTAEVIGHDFYDERIQRNWSLFTWGLMGSGKTSLLEALALRICRPHPKHYLAELKPRLFAVDHKEDLEWGAIVQALGGEYIVAESWDDVHCINIEQAALGVNVSRIPISQRGRFVNDLMDQQWEQVSKRPVSDPWPGFMAMDELNMLAMTRRGRETINRMAKMARGAYWMVAFGSQEMGDVLRRDETAGVGADGLVAAAMKNSSTMAAFQQPSMDRDLLRDRLQLPEIQLDWLIQMGGEDGSQTDTRGQCLLWAQNRHTPIPTQVVLLPHERHLLTANPQLRRGATERPQVVATRLSPAVERRRARPSRRAVELRRRMRRVGGA